jgi:hypothetical protein
VRKRAPLKGALAIQVDIPTHLGLEPRMLGPIVEVPIIFLLVVLLFKDLRLWLLVRLELVLDRV